MELPPSIKLAISVKEKRYRQSRNRLALFWLLAVITVLIALFTGSSIDSLASNEVLAQWIFWPPLICVGIFLATMIHSSYGKNTQYREALSEFNRIHARVSLSDTASSTTDITALIADMESKQTSNPLVEDLLIYTRPLLNKQLLAVHRKTVQKEIGKQFEYFQASCIERAQKLYDQHPLVRAEQTVRNALPRLKRQQASLQAEWESHYAQLSWWKKMNASTPSVFTQIDQDVARLEQLERNLCHQHGDDLKALDKLRSERQRRSSTRLASAKRGMEQLASHSRLGRQTSPSLANKALFFSAMSIPVSAWSDVNNAANVYDVLRDVNANYADSSDMDIWFDTLFMPAESLAGLASLTKGAYLEHLVAEDMGGQLHEHFNTRDTDIVIDGEAFQIKATDSEAYVNSVNADIPVIATSEVAQATDAIDSGYSNEELSTQIDLTLGGSVIDISDTAADAVLSGIGGLGLFATLRGIAHADKQYRLDGDMEKAIIEGAEVAVVGTAKAMVDTAELGYKVASKVTTSAPSRFVGRTLLKGAKALDRKLSGI